MAIHSANADSLDFSVGNSVLQPCQPMCSWVNGLSDGSLRGFGLWFIRLHIRGCKDCRKTVEEFTKLRGHLQRIPEDPQPVLTEEQRATLDTSFDNVDSSLTKDR